ncbi:MAG: DUF2934 domain-containing protein [Kiritimatiellae bacterium]|nr:DUF2934 domain-containing protein [Kiritimatiellia bacterium]
MAVTRKKATKKLPTKSAVTAAAAAPKAPRTSKKAISPEERYKMIELAAYYRAERHGWQVDPHQNWVAAEKEVDTQLSGGKGKAKK